MLFNLSAGAKGLLQTLFKMTSGPRWCRPSKSIARTLVSFYGMTSLVSRVIPCSDCVMCLSGFAGV